MTPKQFTQWLDGFLAHDDKKLSPKDAETIKDKLNMVFNKVTPTKHWHTEGTCDECGYGKNPMDTPQSSFEYIMTGKTKTYLPLDGTINVIC